MKAARFHPRKWSAGALILCALVLLTVNAVAPLPLALLILSAFAGLISLMILLVPPLRAARDRTAETPSDDDDTDLPLLTALDYGYILCGPDYRILSANDVIRDMLGLHNGTFLKATTLQEAFTNLARSGALRITAGDQIEIDRKMTDFQHQASVEFDVRTRQGDWLHIQLQHRQSDGGQSDGGQPDGGQPDGGQPDGGQPESRPGNILVIVRDISKLKRSEHALNRSKSRLKDLAEVASDWFWEMDEDLCFTYFSPRANEVVGSDLRDLIGQKRTVLFSEEDHRTSNVRQHMDDLENHRPFKDFKYIAVMPDGTSRHISSSGIPVFDSGGNFVGYRGAARDITAKAMSEQAALDARKQLERQSHLFQTILNGLEQGIITFSADLKLLTCNRRLRELFQLPDNLAQPGTAIEKVMQYNLSQGWILSGAETEEEKIRMRLEILREDSPEPEQLHHPSGRVLEVYRHRLADDSFVLTYSDISDYQRHEFELRQAKEEAEFANHAKSQFLANMSHELRTPLNAIIGFSEIIRDELYGEINHPEYKDFAKDIHQSGTHLLAIISDLLDLSKIESGQKDLHENRMHLGEAAESCIHYVKQKANVNEVSIRLETAENLPCLYADELIVRQIIINLLSNAVTFTRQGAISIFATVRADNGLRLSIADTGIGMDEKEIAIALTPFAQVESYLTRHHEGTGLGLPLVVNLAKLHGGDILVESEKDRGTTVHVDFPPERTLPDED